MQATSNLDIDADLDSMPRELAPLVEYRFASGSPVPYFPKGTTFTGDKALFMCRVGQASPSDDECAKALGWTKEQIDSQAVEYKMATLGINSKNDKQLYRAGVILGYDEKLAYIPGPNWEKYHAALQKQEEDE